jgi:acetoacetate decarboxylase
MYRLPVGFGPSPGPRQGPDGEPFDPATSKRTTTLLVAFATDPAAVQRLLPPKFEVLEPVVTVKAGVISDIAWLGGRSYSVLGVYVPVEYAGAKRTRGSYCAVLWENLADPILTGREELGMAKLFADIDVEIGDDAASHSVSASWMGYIFARMTLEHLAEAAAAPAQAALPTLNYKYVPRTGEWGVSDVEYATLIPAEDPSLRVEARWTAEGSVTFARPEWRDMPTQSHIVRALADLPRIEERGASLVKTVGGKDLGDVTILE